MKIMRMKMTMKIMRMQMTMKMMRLMQMKMRNADEEEKLSVSFF